MDLVCDACDEVIGSIADAELEWHSLRDTLPRSGLRLVHMGKCGDDECNGNLALSFYVETIGSERLRQKVKDNQLAKEEVEIMIKRLDGVQ